MLLHSIDHIDPATGTPLPNYLSMIFFTIVYRARRLLVDRSADEVRSMCNVINNVGRMEGYKNPDYEMMRDGETMDYAGPRGTVSNAMPSASDAGRLKFNIPNIDIARQEGTLNAKWHELFATLALSFVDKAILTENEPPNGLRAITKTKPIRGSIEAEVAEYAVTAMEAVAIGESILSQDQTLEKELDIRWAEKRQAIARNAGLAKGKTTTLLVDELVEYCRKNDFKNLRKATREFVASQPLTRFVRLTDPVEWLYRKLLERPPVKKSAQKRKKSM